MLIPCWGVRARDQAKEEGFAQLFWQTTACTKHLPGEKSPVRRPAAAPNMARLRSGSPPKDLLLDGDSGIQLVVKQALQLPLSFRLQVFQEELITGQAAVDPGAHKHSTEMVNQATEKTAQNAPPLQPTYFLDCF